MNILSGSTSATRVAKPAFSAPSFTGAAPAFLAPQPLYFATRTPSPSLQQNSLATSSTQARSYWSALEPYNEANLAKISGELNRSVSLPAQVSDNICILATGSDSRREKGRDSKTELIIVYNDLLVQPGQIDDIKSQLAALNALFRMNMDLSATEAKAASHVQSFAFNSGQRVFPQRLMESEPLFGCASTKESSTMAMVSEWLDPVLGRKIKEALRRDKGEHRKIMEAGVESRQGAQIIHYDLATGVANYDASGAAKSLSFKNGPLRFVQVSLTSKLIAHCREKGGPSAYSIVSELPHSTIDKIDFFQSGKIGNLGIGQASEAKESYLYFLHLYHSMASASSTLGIGAVAFDASEAKARISGLADALGPKF